jgi:hypothetical protein
VQERVGNTVELICIGDDFLNRTQMAQQLRIDKCDYMILKASAQQKKWSPDTRDSPQNEENLC